MKIVMIEPEEDTEMPVIEKLLKSNSSYFNLGNAWLIISDEKYDQLYHKLQPFIGNGSLLVLCVAVNDISHYLGYLNQDCREWLNRHLC